MKKTQLPGLAHENQSRAEDDVEGDYDLDGDNGVRKKNAQHTSGQFPHFGV